MKKFTNIRKTLVTLLLMAGILSLCVIPAMADGLELLEDLSSDEYVSEEIIEEQAPVETGASAVQPSIPQIEAIDVRETNLDLSHNLDGSAAVLRGLADRGLRVFDEAGALSSNERQRMENRILELIQDTGMDYVVVITTGIGGGRNGDVTDFADLIYEKGGFGVGDEHNGSLFLYVKSNVPGESTAWISTAGMAQRYITDKAIDYIFDEYEGSGVIGPLANGAVFDGCMRFLEGTRFFYKDGIYQDQHNYDTDTGETDYYYPQKKRSLSLIEIAISAALSALIGVSPVNSVKRKYAMQTEKRLAQGVNQAYKQTAKFAVDMDAGRLINTSTTTRRIPRSNTGGGRSGGGTSGLGGGRTTVHTSSGGMSHGGGGRKF